MNHRTIFLFVLLTAGWLLAAQAPQQGSGPAQTKHDQMLGLVPDPLPAGTSSNGAPAFYVPDNLYQYMDGGADIFLYYDFQKLFHQEFRAGQVDLTVDIFDMGNLENAFGIYAAERAPSYNFIPIGTEAYKNDGILNFFQGAYYVKLAAFGDGNDAVMEQFAQTLSTKIGDKGSFPDLLQKFPPTHLKRHSEQYLVKDPLGHPFLRPAYVATYTMGDQESTLLVSVATNESDAQQRLKQLDQHFRETGKSEAAPEIGANAIRASNSFEGTLIAQAKGRYMVALFNPTADGPEILKEALGKLK